MITALRTSGSQFADADGRPVRLRGVGLGGWLNMENFITGYAAQRGADARPPSATCSARTPYELFFERLLSVFFADEDAALLAATGLNCVRVPVNYRHFEDDARPFEIKPDGFRHLDRVIDAVRPARHLHGDRPARGCRAAQNHHWHRDNPTHVPLFWDAPRTSRTGSSTSGSTSPIITGTTPAWPATT